MERNPESCFYIHRRAVLCGGLELPLGDGFGGELSETIVDSAQYAHAADRAVGVDDPVQDDRAAHVLAHQLERVGGIDLARGYGCGEIGRGGIALR